MAARSSLHVRACFVRARGGCFRLHFAWLAVCCECVSCVVLVLRRWRVRAVDCGRCVRAQCCCSVCVRCTCPPPPNSVAVFSVAPCVLCLVLPVPGRLCVRNYQSVSSIICTRIHICNYALEACALDERLDEATRHEARGALRHSSGLLRSGECEHSSQYVWRRMLDGGITWAGA
jgi:hypothetical protein